MLRRKVKGFEELEISDYRIGSLMQVVGEMGKFLWRSKRSQINKTLEFDGSLTAKVTNQIMQTDVKEFISEFANVCEKEPEKVKSTRLASKETQGAHETLSLDSAFQSALEKAATENPGSDIRATLLDLSLLSVKLKQKSDHSQQKILRVKKPNKRPQNINCGRTCKWWPTKKANPTMASNLGCIRACCSKWKGAEQVSVSGAPRLCLFTKGLHLHVHALFESSVCPACSWGRALVYCVLYIVHNMVLKFVLC